MFILHSSINTLFTKELYYMRIISRLCTKFSNLNVSREIYLIYMQILSSKA